VSGARWSDRRIVLWIVAVMVVLIIAVTIFAPQNTQDDPRPTTFNSGPNGAKAAFLMLQAIGRTSARWERPLNELDSVPAEQTTLILAAPTYDGTAKDEIAAAVKRFLQRGGRVLTTGGTGALLLPGGSAEQPSMFQFAGCRTTPGDGPLAAAGSVRMMEVAKWKGNAAPDAAKVEVAQRCGDDAVVVTMKVGRGEAVWWSSANALTNAGIKDDGALRLLLLSVGDGRAVEWDESLHGEVVGLWSKASGLPLGWLTLQVVLVAVLLVLSFSRRNGPLRAPVMLPRSSPAEFAASMGDLYEKARATGAATEAARRRLVRVMVREAGVPRAAIEGGPQAMVAALNERLGGDWRTVGEHLEQASEAAQADGGFREALALTKALSEDAERVRAAVRGGRGVKALRVA
jgi:hypothetical protein